MRTRIKFCGMVRPTDIDAAVALGVDAVGFVFYPKSPRYLTVDEARALRERLPSSVQAVGLFVNAEAAEVRATRDAVGLDVVQFHGDEPPSTCLEVGGRWWKAVRMRPGTDLLELAKSFALADSLLLDSFSDGFGGSGKTFDWSWIPPGLPSRIVLSGGLDDASVGPAISMVAPYAVDVSSGIQGATPRQKDPARMERFVAAVQSADEGRA
jgi:phosphoribosylanthranilate isomerase